MDSVIEIACPPSTTLAVEENCAVAFERIPNPSVLSKECDEVTFTKSLAGSIIDGPLGVGEYIISATATDASSNTATCTFTLEVVDEAPIHPEACLCSGNEGGGNVLQAANEGETYNFACDPKPNGCPQQVESIIATDCISCEPIRSASGKSQGKKKSKSKKGCVDCGVDLDESDENEFVLDQLGPAGSFLFVGARIVDNLGNVGFAQCTFCVSEAADTGKSSPGRSRRTRKGKSRAKSKSSDSDSSVATFACPAEPILFECPPGFEEV